VLDLIFIGLVIGIILMTLLALRSFNSIQVPPVTREIKTMRERQAALQQRMREQTGHVSTVMIPLPPKDHDGE
jgi:hypothetical protein